MPGKEPKDYDLDEVAIWLTAIGLESKVDGFRENAVDGSMLVSLTADELKEDLGLTNLQAKKVLTSLEFTKDLANEQRGGSSEKIDALEAELASVKAENEELKKEIAELKEPKTAVPAQAPAPAPAAPPPHKTQKKKNDHEILRGGARGAAGGAIMGAAIGAAAGDAGKGAKIGAAAGGTGGALRGARHRRLIR